MERQQKSDNGSLEAINRTHVHYYNRSECSPTSSKWLDLGAENYQGEEWKRLRKRFNPGFAPGHLFSLLPCILDKTSVFMENLDGYAKTGEEFHLNELCVNLTFDIIGMQHTSRLPFYSR